jgi:hypothetical protein
VLSDANIQRYAKSLYPISFLLILVPLMDLTLRALPPQFGSLQWRFGTVGLLLGNFGTILLGTALVGFVAAIAGDRRTLRVIGYVAMLLAVLTVALLALFVLDALQMRQLANANYKRVVLLSASGAMFAGILGTIALIAIARGALAASRGSYEVSRRQRAASPLVVAGQGASDA